MDRKEMIRQYKQRKPPMGVYRIRNTITGNQLVAASVDVEAILNRHRGQLRLGAHPSKMLQADCRAHGPDSFTFEILDTLTPPDDPGYDPLPDLTVLEDLWLERLSLKADHQHSINPGRLAWRKPG